MDAFFGVLVAAVVAEPDIVAAVDEGEGQAALAGGQTDPDVAVHHKAVVEVDDLFANAAGGVDADMVFTTAPGEAMEAEQVAITCLDNVLLAVVTVQLAQLGKVAGVRNGAPDALLLLA